MHKLLTLALLFFAIVTYGQKLEVDLALKYRVQAPSHTDAHTRMIVLLHGYGSNEQDMFGLTKVLPSGCIIVSAQAPYSLGNDAYQWYAITSDHGTRDADTAHMAHSVQTIARFLGQLQKKYHVDANHTYLSGFSQGAIMSYYTGFTHPELMRGIAPLSGKLYPVMQTKLKRSSKLDQLRIFAAHGTADDVIGYDEGKAAITFLQGKGLKPELHTYQGVAHTITKEEIADLNKWLLADKAK